MSADIGLRQAWSLTFNVITKKPSLDKNERNELIMTSRSTYQITVAVNESNANVNVSQLSTTF